MERNIYMKLRGREMEYDDVRSIIDKRITELMNTSYISGLVTRKVCDIRIDELKIIKAKIDRWEEKFRIK